MSQRQWAIWESQTGKISYVYSADTDRDLAGNTPTGFSAMEITNSPLLTNIDRFYVDVETLALRLIRRFPIFVEDPVGTWTAAVCPEGMEVEIWDLEINQLITTVMEVAGVIEITLPDPGSYSFKASMWPYHPIEIEVTV